MFLPHGHTTFLVSSDSIREGVSRCLYAVGLAPTWRFGTSRKSDLPDPGALCLLLSTENSDGGVGVYNVIYL